MCELISQVGDKRTENKKTVRVGKRCVWGAEVKHERKGQKRGTKTGTHAYICHTHRHTRAHAHTA